MATRLPQEETEIVPEPVSRAPRSFPPFKTSMKGKATTDLVTSAVPFQQHNMVAYATVLNPQDLIGRASVPTYDPTTGSGYQRTLNPQRVKLASRYVRTPNGMFPGALVLSVRGKDRDKLVYRGGKLTVPRNVRIHILDGQTRLNGCWRAQAEGAELGSFGLPAVILLTKNELDEASIFRTIHREQKRLSTDLVDTILDKEIESGRMSMSDLGGSVKAHRATAVQITAALRTTPSSPWFERISLPNKEIFFQKSGTNGSGWVPSSAFVGSLASIVNKVGAQRPETLAKVVQSYWEAVRLVCPRAWKDPENYAYMHRSPAIYVMHTVFPVAYQEAVELGGPTVKNFATVLRRGIDDEFFSTTGDLRGTGTWQSYREVGRKVVKKIMVR